MSLFDKLRKKSEPQAAVMPQVVLYPNQVLRFPSATVEKFSTPALRVLVNQLMLTMYSYHGVGLAAPQISVGMRVCVIDVTAGADPEQKLTLINPEIVESDGWQTEREGCLSLPDVGEQVKRALRVKVRYQDVDGSWHEKVGEGLLARALQHEIDHLDGKLYIDRLSALKRDFVQRRYALKLAERYAPPEMQHIPSRLGRKLSKIR